MAAAGEALTATEVKYSEKNPEKFLKLLFIQFPHLTADSCGDACFWDAVCKTFTNLSHAGELEAAKYTS